MTTPLHDDARRRRRRAQRRGIRAEYGVAVLLTLCGWRILGLRVRTFAGEIDVVACRGDSLLFAEVRRRADFETAAYSLTADKQARLRRAASAWIAERRPYADCDMRFDAFLCAPWRLPRRIRHVLR